MVHQMPFLLFLLAVVVVVVETQIQEMVAVVLAQYFQGGLHLPLLLLLALAELRLLVQ
jgi:hypothetical protein